MASTLRIGARGIEVIVLQLQLNAQGATPQLTVDGAFGTKTQTAVIAFQRKAGLSPDGVVGPLTQAALAKTGSAPTVVAHPVTHIPQPTPTTCWAASTAMMTRSTVAAVVAKTPPDMIASDGGLKNSSGSDQAIVTGARYGALHGLHCHAPMSWSVAGLIGVLRRSPLMLDMLWNSAEYAQGKGSPGHMVVVSAVVSDDDQTGEGTYLLILDPWPPHKGKISWVPYGPWIREVPTRTYRVFERA